MAAKKATVKPVVKPMAKPAEAAVKVEAPKTESVKAEDKATTPEAPVKAEGNKAEASTAKKTAEKKTAAKKAPAKKTSAKAELKAELHVQFADQSLTQDDLVKIAKDVWKYDLNQKVGDLKSVELYVKPEERKAYYVMNKEFTGSFGI